MGRRAVRGVSALTSTWSALPALLVVAVVVGVLGMHSLVLGAPAPPAGTSPTVVSDHAAPHHASGSASAPDAIERDEKHDTEAACGGAVAVCLALLIGLGAFAVLRRSASRRVLWSVPSAFYVHLGTVRAPFPSLSPLQRTAVLRC